MAPKGTNSSKTEHVMNLLRKNSPAETPPRAAAEEKLQPSTPTPAPAPAPRNKLPILTALNADVAVSSKIKDALESALLMEEATPTPVATLDMYADTDEPIVSAPAPKSVPTSVPIAASAEASAPVAIPKVPAPAAASTPVAASVPAATPAPVETAAAAPTPAATPALTSAEVPASNKKLSQEEIERMLRAMVEENEAPSAPPPPPVPEPIPAPEPVPEPEPMNKAELFNIMLMLAEEKADKYIKMFGLCNCERCRQDVLALTLNEISVKYVVVPPAEMTIRADMYRSHYDSEITVQILRACQKVMENPRH